MNIGSGQVGAGFGNTYDPRLPTDGLFWYGSKVRITDIADGSSNTLVWSQCLRGTNGSTLTGTPRSALYYEQRRRMYANLPGRGVLATGGLNPQLNETEAENATTWVSNRGGSWIWGNGSVIGFVAYLPPNSPIPDAAAHRQGWFSARSKFSGGVNVALADGSVRFVRDSIAMPTWRPEFRPQQRRQRDGPRRRGRKAVV